MHLVWQDDTVIVMMLMTIRLRLFISRFLPGSPFSVSYPFCHFIEIKVHHKSGIITSGIGVLNMNFSHLIRHSEWGTVFSYSFIFIAGFWRLRLVSNHRCQCLLYNRNKLPLWCKSNAQKDKHDSAHGTQSDHSPLSTSIPHTFQLGCNVCACLCLLNAMHRDRNRLGSDSVGAACRCCKLNCFDIFAYSILNLRLNLFFATYSAWQ